ncbi:MAG: XRE family transcriptional regulator [Chitinophagaceae bacterium]|nr:MAG: XRE family transcriptional regulator [Chitinophagaceae bacterium]
MKFSIDYLAKLSIKFINMLPRDPFNETAPSDSETKMPTSQPVAQILMLIGEQIQLARKRRMLSQEQFARDLGMSRSTLRSIEKGARGIALSTYIRIFLLMGKHLELIQFASTDYFGRKLQDERMLARKHKLQLNQQPETIAIPIRQAGC